MRTVLLVTFLLVFLLIGYCAIAQDSLPVVLLTSETVKDLPRLQFVDSAGAVHEIPLSGTAPGRVFNGNLAFSENVASGSGEFRIVPGSMIDLSGISGTEITSGRYYYIPNRVSAAVYQNRTYDYITRKLIKP